MDPFKERILAAVQDLLQNKEQVTISEVIDALNQRGVQAGDSAVRIRVGQLVKSERLICLPGVGRRPSYYSLPSTALSADHPNDGNAALEAIELSLDRAIEEADKLRQGIEKDMERLNELMADIDAYQRVKQKIQMIPHEPMEESIKVEAD